MTEAQRVAEDIRRQIKKYSQEEISLIWLQTLVDRLDPPKDRLWVLLMDDGRRIYEWRATRPKCDPRWIEYAPKANMAPPVGGWPAPDGED